MQALILLVCSIILTSFVRELEGIDLLHSKLMNKSKLLLDKQNVLRECFCLPVNNAGKRVSEVISPNGKHKGRLVVYLYKTPNNQLTVYVPNREKQLAIPDLMLEEGEVLDKITNSKVKDLFETSTSIVVPKPGKHLTDHGYIHFNLNKPLNELLNINENYNLKDPNLQNTEQQEINNENPSSVLQFENEQPMNVIEDNMNINPDELLQIPEGSLQVPEGSLQVPEGSLQVPEGSQKIPKDLESIVTYQHSLPQHTLESEQPLVEIEQPPKHPDSLIGPSLVEDNIHINPDELLQIPEGSLQVPEGSLQIPEGSLQVPDGSLQVPEGSLQISEGLPQVPEGSLQIPEGSLQIPEGSPQAPEGSLQLPEGSLQIPKELESIVTYPHRLPQHTLELEQPLVEIEQSPKHPDTLVRPEGGILHSADVSGSVEYSPPTETAQIIEPDTNIVPSPGQQEKPNDNIFSSIKPQQPSEIHNQEPQPSTQIINAEILPETADHMELVPPGITSDNSIGLSIGTKPNKPVVVKPSPDKSKLIITENQPNSAKVVPNENVQVSIEPNVQDSGSKDLSYNLWPMKQFQDLMLNFPNQNPDKAILFPHGYRPPKHTLSDKMTFDQWLIEQIRLLQQHKPFMYYSINIDALKLVVLRALQNNGINISSTGVLKDSHGKTVQISNLQLQPILLGDPVEYEKLLALNKCILPYNLPYLKAMFVTLSYPPRILGIIYLGDRYHKCTHGLCPHTTRCHSNHCRQPGVSHTQTVIVHSTKSTPGLPQIVEIPSSDRYNPKLNNKLLGTFSRRINNDLEQTDDNSAQQQLIPDSALEPFPDDSISRPNHEEVKDENIQPLEDLFSSHDNKVEDVGDYDDLGIRIIGGQPATASGTPITSKGRSGYDD